MSLNMPRLDDRQFQDLVNEAKSRITHYCPEWTDHNVSDPGVTMIELFAYMVDILLYRVNQLPQVHAVKLLEMFGIKLAGPQPARVRATFWLSAPQPLPVIVPAGTEISTTQTETELPVIFTTDEDLCVQPPELAAVLSLPAGGENGSPPPDELNLRRLAAGFEGWEVFSPTPAAGDGLYFGFENDLSYHLLNFEMDFDPAFGVGIDPTLPPYTWQAWSGPEAGWQPCFVETDSTRGMNTAGRARLHLPPLVRRALAGKDLFWVRAYNREVTAELGQEGMRPYRKSPRLRRAAISSVGGSVPALQARIVTQEEVGRSDGSPGQRFGLKFFPVLARRAGETLLVQDGQKPPVPWQEVDDFSASGETDCHYTLDSLTGELRFGPAIRQPDGSIKRYGAFPPQNARLVFTGYRYGGGTAGNVQAGAVNTLKTAIPFIARVSNREAAAGGLDGESLEAALMRLPAMLRTRDRAVTEADFEYFACQALPGRIGRVKCLQPPPVQGGQTTPGLVYLLVIPKASASGSRLLPEQLSLSPEEIRGLAQALDERRLLTTRLSVRAPAYQWAAVKTRLRLAPGADSEQARAVVLDRLYRFINPLTGGRDGNGWPFGRSLYLADLYALLQDLPGVVTIEGLEMFRAQADGQPREEPEKAIDVVPYGVIASGEHSVEFV